MISAILLAAGESKRMGKPKQLMPLGRTSILEQTIDNYLNSEVNEVIVVLGHRAEEAKRIMAARPVKLAINPNYQQGMSTSIIAGLNMVDSRARAVVIALGDQPFIDSQTLNRLIDEFYNHDKGIVIPVYRGRRGHPVIFAIRYKDELFRLKGDIGGREIIDRYPDDVLEVPVNCEGIYIDIDTNKQLLERMKLR
jgi:molybdenum cofactor cytidylyltransferase